MTVEDIVAQLGAILEECYDGDVVGEGLGALLRLGAFGHLLGLETTMRKHRGRFMLRNAAAWMQLHDSEVPENVSNIQIRQPGFGTLVTLDDTYMSKTDRKAVVLRLCQLAKPRPKESPGSATGRAAAASGPCCTCGGQCVKYTGNKNGRSYVECKQCGMKTAVAAY